MPTQSSRKTGIIVRIHKDGYAFIRPDEGGADFFVNIADMRNRSDWVENQPVSFLPGPVHGGPQAQKVKNVIAIHEPEAAPAAETNYHPE